MMKFIRTLFGKEKVKEYFEQFQEHQGGYLYKTPDGDYMLFEKAEKKISPDNMNR